MAAEPPKKRPRPAGDGEDLKRAAEIIMVLSAIGEMRGGAGPSAVEKALVAEASELLTRVCEAVKPKDLFSREAVRVLVEDLGLNRSKDPMMGFRPPKMSIVEKLELTKKKMEEKESKEPAPHSSVYSSQFHPGGFSTNPEANNTLFHGTPKFLPDKPTQLSISGGGFQTATPITFIPSLASTSSSLKPSQVSVVQPAGASLRSSGSSVERASTPAAITRPEVTHFRLDLRSGGPTFVTHVQDKSATTAAHPTSVSTVRLGQANKSQDVATVKPEGICEVDAAQTSSATENQELKNVSVQTLPGNLFVGNQPAGLTYVHPPSGFPNHNEIAQMVQKVLQQKASELSNWTPPSTDYMNKPLNCQICKITVTDVENLLVCDACEKGTHLKCLQSYGNKSISKLEWHCPKCLVSSNGKPLPPKYGRVTRALAVSKVSSSSDGTRASTETKADISDSKINHQNPIGNYSSHPSATGNNSLGSTEAKAETAGLNHQSQSGNPASFVHASAAGSCAGSTEAKAETAESKINHQNLNGNSSSLVHASAAGGSLGSTEAKAETADSKTNYQNLNGNSSSLVCASAADSSLGSTEAKAETADSKINHQNTGGNSPSLVDAAATVSSLGSSEAKAETADAKINHQNPSGNSSSLVHGSSTETKAEIADSEIIHQNPIVNSTSLVDALVSANNSLRDFVADTMITNRKDMQDVSSSANTKMEDWMHTGTHSGPSEEMVGEDCVNQCQDSKHSITNIDNSMLPLQKPSDESELRIKGGITSNQPQESDKLKNGEHPSGTIVIPCQSQVVGSQFEDKPDVGISVESSADICMKLAKLT